MSAYFLFVVLSRDGLLGEILDKYDEDYNNLFKKFPEERNTIAKTKAFTYLAL
ncbi:hypothetical protein [Sporosarcina sp. FSL W7-1283]|uniref:hypothetical protein n=1 Tax=Sporosarcina sp. FSL W7-1283 TaxID=2921560 RepID=UPI0030F543EF